MRHRHMISVQAVLRYTENGNRATVPLRNDPVRLLQAQLSRLWCLGQLLKLTETFYILTLYASSWFLS